MRVNLQKSNTPFLEICDDRYNRRSTILTSQLPVEKWHAQIGDPTLADSILDRLVLVHNAYRIETIGRIHPQEERPGVPPTAGREGDA